MTMYDDVCDTGCFAGFEVLVEYGAPYYGAVPILVAEGKIAGGLGKLMALHEISFVRYKISIVLVLH